MSLLLKFLTSSNSVDVNYAVQNLKTVIHFHDTLISLQWIDFHICEDLLYLLPLSKNNASSIIVVGISFIDKKIEY